MIDNYIVFLYLNGLHHLYHTAETVIEFAKLHSKYRTVCVTCCREYSEIMQGLIDANSVTNCEIVEIPLPFRFKYLNFKKKSYPSPCNTTSRVAKLLWGAKAIVTTSHATVKLCQRFKIECPKIIYQYHGCGDGKYGFSKTMGTFDLLLLPGIYHQQRLIAENVTTIDKTRVVGWPKLDYKIDVNNLKKELFGEDKPIVLYTPHWNPKISSYQQWGEAVLEYFSRQTAYNLIFAPHIQIKHWSFKFRYKTNIGSGDKRRIVVDFGSRRSVDSSYVRIADLFLGDVSSLIYEWIAIRPRPCVFLNAQGIDWKGNVNYRHWDYGPVVEDISQLGDKLQKAIKSGDYLDIQRDRITSYIDKSNEPASRRAAKAIYDYVCNNHTQKS
ncbi:MAG: CDP-glycerol glycerophosphotransferase family protein [archaeon]